MSAWETTWISLSCSCGSRGSQALRAPLGIGQHRVAGLRAQRDSHQLYSKGPHAGFGEILGKHMGCFLWYSVLVESGPVANLGSQFDSSEAAGQSLKCDSICAQGRATEGFLALCL